MDEPATEPQGSGLSLGDVYFVLFRHKWKILLLTLAGLAGAAVVFFAMPRRYQSEAKILIRYVLENKGVNPAARDAQIKSPDARGENILYTEVEILNSIDLALEVADAIGPERLLAKAGGGSNRYDAAALISKCLSIQVPNKGNVILAVFTHPDRDVAQPALQHLIERYLLKHFEIHRGAMLDPAITDRTRELGERLAQTEEELRKLKAKAGVISLEETRKSLIEEMSKIRQDLNAAEAELGERKASLEALEKLTPAKSEAAATELGVSVEKLNEYKNLCGELDALHARRRELLSRYREESPLVKGLLEQIASAESLKKQLEQQNPRLLTAGMPAPSSNAPPVDLAVEFSRVKALEAKIAVLNSQFENVHSNAVHLDQAESAILQVQRRKELEETNYRYFSSSLEQSRIDDALGAGRYSNISVVQKPTTPAVDRSKIKKLMGIVFGVGLLGGLAWAFLLEMLLDQSVKRAIELETKLRLPVFLSIPAAVGCSRGRAGKAPLQLAEHSSESGLSSTALVPSMPGVGGGAAPWDPDHALRDYHEALRERLMTYFEAHNMKHKPKLVAVTGCSGGAGTTTIAAGLAATLSETGDGNVLLVDMNLRNGAAHPFYRGKPGCRLADVLEGEKPHGARVQENLYLASVADANGDLPGILPKRFTHLVPKMKASDYDYIIFDMPAMSQVSITPRLAGYMDMVLLVVEAEKTSREVVRRAASMLSESKANVATVFNKGRKYIPEWLHQEL